MRAAIHQPQYLPWLGYFDKMDQADCFVILDNVQFKKNEWQNRNRIRTARGWQWLTVPVLHRFPQLISEVRIHDEAHWARQHVRALHLNYGQAPFFEAHRRFFDDLYAREWTRLVDLNVAVIFYLTGALGITTKLVLASTLSARGEATARLVDICRILGADTYLSGAGARAYLDDRCFQENDIRVVFQSFECPSYPQRSGAFVPDLSIVDLLFNCGEASLSVLRNGRERR
jgi:hypothetical protein